MNRIRHLVREVCRNGVPRPLLGEIAVFKRGRQLREEDRIPGEYPVVTAGRVEAGTHGEFNFPSHSVTVTSHGAYAGHVNFWTSPIWLANNVFLLEPRSDILVPRYFFYCLKSIEHLLHATSQGGGVPYINPSDLAILRIPVPPIELQREIVLTLDTFTALEAELEAELEARRRQYEYYRMHLLRPALSTRTPWVALGDIGRVSMCRRVFKEQTSTAEAIPFFKIGTFGGAPDSFISEELFRNYRQRYPFPKKGEVLLSAAGTIGRAVQYDGAPAYFQDSNIVWLENDERLVLNRYLFHQYQIMEWATDGGTIRRLYNDNLKAARIPVPPIVEQERIVSILDSFDALVNDLSVGLPAELAARRRQYEYYRDRLLTFEEAPS